jgi:hypothetical protein
VPCIVNAFQIRCSGERPACNRCVRLGHSCTYSSKRPSAQKNSKPQQGFLSVTRAREVRQVAISEAVQIQSNASNVHKPLLVGPVEQDCYLGIPKDLVSTLVQVYYENVYNAALLLHKKSFLESLAAGTARPHVVLSVCAWAAKYARISFYALGIYTNCLTFSFYRDSAGQAPLRDHGFMIEWAKQAGKLVFQEAEDLHEDNIVTFCNLALFWHSQGSWRIAYLHKGIYFEESSNVLERSSYSINPRKRMSITLHYRSRASNADIRELTRIRNSTPSFLGMLSHTLP